MDGTDATAWPLGWSLLRGYFSPATLFLLLNVVIGTIALTSRRRHHHGDDEHYKAQHQHHHHEPRCCHGNQYAPPPPPAPLARTSSVVERLRSLGLYRFHSGDFPPEYNISAAANAICDETEKQQAQYTRSRSEPAARPPPPVEQKRKEEKAAAAAAKAKAVKKSNSEVRKLERAPAQARQVVQRGPPPPRAPARAVQASAREEESAEPVRLATASSVDARADDFINKFREQLQLQRLNSLLNHNEMLNRGT